MSDQHRPAFDYENPKSLAHLLFLESLSPAQLAGLLRFIAETAADPGRRTTQDGIVHTFVDRRYPLVRDVVAIEMSDPLVALRCNAVCGVLAIGVNDPALAEQWALQLMADQDKEVRALAQKILGAQVDEWRARAREMLAAVSGLTNPPSDQLA